MRSTVYWMTACSSYCSAFVGPAVGDMWAAPPCKEFSHLKLSRPGPKALRTPQRMDGVPGLSAEEEERVDQSTDIHPRSPLCAAVQSSAQGGFEQPPSAMSWIQEDNIALLREWAAHCSCVPALLLDAGAMCHVCIHRIVSIHMPTSTRFASGHCRAPARWAICQLSHRGVPATHGKENGGAHAPLWVQARTAQSPSTSWQSHAYTAGQQSMMGLASNSTADHTNPNSSALKPLSTALLSYLSEKNLVEDVLRSLAQGNADHPTANTDMSWHASCAATCIPSATTQHASLYASSHPSIGRSV